MREGVGRRGIGQIVRRHVNGLHGGDGTLGRGSDALLEVAHFGGQRGLITHGGWRTAEQGGDFGAGLRETEHVVDEEKHVLVLLIAEVFRHGEEP